MNDLNKYEDNDINELNNSNETFNYDSISGLGQSDYENEDLFNIEENTHSNEEINTNEDYKPFDFNGEYVNNISNNDDFVQNTDDYNVGLDTFNNDIQSEQEINNVGYLNTINDSELNQTNFEDGKDSNNYENTFEESYNDKLVENTFEEPYNDQLVENTFEESNNNQLAENTFEESNDDQAITDDKIEMSDVDINELKNLTKYKEDDIEKTDIKALFDKVSVNVKDASEIFRKNTDLKEKIDSRFEELKALQLDIENSKRNQINEINNYKEEVFDKLTEKKDEIEKRLNTLKDLQASLEQEKEEFEQYKKSENEKIDKIQKEVQTAYDDRREELNKIEDKLRKQKDALDEERNQLSLDKIQYESDKNELANNLLKFNELVDSFTNGMNGIKE